MQLIRFHSHSTIPTIILTLQHQKNEFYLYFQPWTSFQKGKLWENKYFLVYRKDSPNTNIFKYIGGVFEGGIQQFCKAHSSSWLDQFALVPHEYTTNCELIQKEISFPFTDIPGVLLSR